MRTSKFAFLCAVLALFLVSCSSQQTGMGPSANLPAHASTNGSITAGESVTGTFRGGPLTYTLTAASNGTLTLRLAWDPVTDGAKLQLTIDDRSVKAAPPEWSPVVGVATVAGGKTYRITVDEGEAPWDYGFNDQFTLTASLEPSGGPFDY